MVDRDVEIGALARLWLRNEVRSGRVPRESLDAGHCRRDALQGYAHEVTPAMRELADAAARRYLEELVEAYPEGEPPWLHEESELSADTPRCQKHGKALLDATRPDRGCATCGAARVARNERSFQPIRAPRRKPRDDSGRPSDKLPRR